MQAIYLATNTEVTLTVTITNNLNQPFNPATAPTVDIWQDNGNSTYTHVISAAAMSNFQSVVGVYTYAWNLANATPGNYILIYSYYQSGVVNPYTETDTVQLVNFSYIGSGGSGLGFVNLTDANSGDPLSGIVVWLSTSSTSPTPKSCTEVTNAFGYAEWYVQNGTYYVYSPNYDTWLGTLVVSGTAQPIFTLNPNLTF